MPNTLPSSFSSPLTSRIRHPRKKPVPIHPASAMSRPASESLGAVKRTRTTSSCADSVDPPSSFLRAADLPSVALPLPSSAKPASAHHHNPRKRLRPDPPPQHPVAALFDYDYAPYHRQQFLHHVQLHNPATLHHHLPQAEVPKLGRRAVHYPAQNVPQHVLTAAMCAGSGSGGGGGPQGVNMGYAHQQQAAAQGGYQPQTQTHRPHRGEAIEKRPRAADNGGSSRCMPTKPGGGHYALPLEDDAEGHLIYKLGEGLNPNSEFPHGRYKILSDLGEGTFGKVVECWDRREGKRVAIKVVRSVTKYREAARLEINVLHHLNKRDPEGFYHCVKLYSWFDYRAHVCMVFEKLGPSLYEQLRRNRFQPFPLDQVREYAFQLLESVNFVHNLTLIHTDLKPENILLVDSKQQSNAIKLIDFGSATFETHHHSAVISTRHYRAPEVILGLGWTYPCDLWSIGCILVELYTGKALFQTHENLEHLAMMSGVLGPIPDSMVRRADRSGQKYFSRMAGGRRALNWPAGASSKESLRLVRNVQALPDISRCPEGHANFFDLVHRLLAFEPDTRCTSAEALKHPFFREASHESDPPLTTPTLSSGSSACGSNGGSVLRGRYKGSSRRKSGLQNQKSTRGNGRRGNGGNQVEDEGDDTATEMPTAAQSIVTTP